MSLWQKHGSQDGCFLLLFCFCASTMISELENPLLWRFAEARCNATRGFAAAAPLRIPVRQIQFYADLIARQNMLTKVFVTGN